MVNKITHFVEIMCKTLWKSPCKFRANFCEKLTTHYFPVYKKFYSPAFPTHSTIFFTTKSPEILTSLFHYSTTPTITTTKYFNN